MRAGAGRPPGATGKKKKRITVSLRQDYIDWINDQTLSQGKTIERLIQWEIDRGCECVV